MFNIKLSARKITRNLDLFKIFTSVFHTVIFFNKYNTFCRTGVKSTIGFRNIENKYLEQISNGSFRQYGIRLRFCGGQWGRNSYTFCIYITTSFLRSSRGRTVIIISSLMKRCFLNRSWWRTINCFIWRTIGVLDSTIVYSFYDRNFDSRFLVNWNLLKVFQQRHRKSLSGSFSKLSSFSCLHLRLFARTSASCMSA